MRCFAPLAFVVAAPIASAGEVLSTPERYEECLIAHGALIVSSEGVDVVTGTETAKQECAFTGKNRALVDQVATAEARKKIAATLPALDKIQDRDFVRHASCLAEEAKASLRAQPRMTIRGATRAAIPKCPHFENSHKRDLWEVLVVANMDVAQQLEAASDGAAHPASAGEPAPGPYPLEGKQMTLADLVVDARSLMKQRVSITDGCDITQTSNMFIICSQGTSFVYLSSSTADRETLRFALKNCAGPNPTRKCRAFAVIGTVGGLFLNSTPVLNSAVIYFDSEQGE